MPDALSLPRSDLPEEIERAIQHLARICVVAPGFDDAVIANRNIRNGVDALTAAILSRLGEAEARREEAEAYGREVGSALVGLTCDGSEFYHRGGADWRVDPAACAAYVRRQRSDKHDSILRFAKRASEAEAARDAALARVERLEKRVNAALDDACRMSAILLMAGEMTAQERRTARAVANGLASKVRTALSEAQPQGDH